MARWARHPLFLARDGRVVDEDWDVQPTIRLLQDPFVAEAGMADPEQLGHGQGVPIPADVVVFALEWEAGVSKTRGHHRTADHIGPVGEAFKGVPSGIPAWPNFGRRHLLQRAPSGGRATLSWREPDYNNAAGLIPPN